ncbi:YfhE family protein [Niallia sp. FSL W8-0177]
MEGKKKQKTKHTLSSMQAVTYQHEFKMADRAANRKDTK